MKLNSFCELSHNDLEQLNGGSLTGILAIIGAIITIYGIYDTGKSHIYDYNYDKAYTEEKERLEQSSRRPMYH